MISRVKESSAEKLHCIFEKKSNTTKEFWAWGKMCRMMWSGEGKTVYCKKYLN